MNGFSLEMWIAYAAATGETAQYPEETADQYLAAGLFAEIGEVVGVYAKSILKGTERSPETLTRYAEEIGDVLWYVAQLAQRRGLAAYAWEQALVAYSYNKPGVIAGRARPRWSSLWADIADLADTAPSPMVDPDGEGVAGVMFNVAALCDTLGFDLGEVCRDNLAKLADRAERGVIKGDGDHR